MTTYIGTDGPDLAVAPHTGDYAASTGAGNDEISVIRDDISWGVVTVDAGDGDDLIHAKNIGRSSVTIHGGAGADTFDLGSAVVVYGDAGPDIFRVGQLSGLGTPFTIADFSAEDRLDITPFLQHSDWDKATSPFATGFARLIQVGADTLVQLNNGDHWVNIGLIANQDATKLTAAQLGYAPHVETATFISAALDRAAVTGGGQLVMDLTLSAPLSQAFTVFVALGLNHWYDVDPQDTWATFAPGQTRIQVTLSIRTDADSPAPLKFQLVPGDGVYVDPHLQPILLPFVDAGFSVAPPVTAAEAYRNLTLLDAVKPQDLASLPASLPVQAPRIAARALEPYVLATTSVALTAYEFFTGKSPSKAGLAYLINSPDNANDLNDAGGAYAAMNTENRYINFAANLGLVGEGKAAFASAYGGLTFRQAVEKAYETVIGKDLAADAGIDVAKAVDGVVAAQGYFDALASERMGGFDHDLAMKAGMIGYLIAEGQKAHVGVYARAVENFYIDFLDGTAQHNVDLVAVYGPGSSLDLV